jgi:hypothetical protein
MTHFKIVEMCLAPLFSIPTHGRHAPKPSHARHFPLHLLFSCFFPPFSSILTSPRHSLTHGILREKEREGAERKRDRETEMREGDPTGGLATGRDRRRRRAGRPRLHASNVTR